LEGAHKLLLFRNAKIINGEIKIIEDNDIFLSSIQDPFAT